MDATKINERRLPLASFRAVAGLLTALSIAGQNGEIALGQQPLSGEEATSISSIAETAGEDVDVRRALVLFVRFRDDSTATTGCTEAAREWRDPDSVPEFATYAFSATSAPPFDPRSLTDYFFQQSNGKLILYGAYLNRVIVTRYTAADYAASTATTTIDLESLAREIIDNVNGDPGLDFAEFDRNEDGRVDFVYIIVRNLMGMRLTGGGAAGLARLGYNSGPVLGADPNNRKHVIDGRSGAFIRYNNPGNIFPRINLFRLMAHEFVHGYFEPYQQMGFVGHVAPHADRNAVGYMLMASARNCAGSQTISAPERDRWDWIECITPASDTTLAVNDLYTARTSNCVKLELRNLSNGTDQLLYLSNRQRTGAFDTLLTESCYGERSDHGLMTTGLLATTVDVHRRYATIPADNHLELGLTADVYAGDMFGPDSPQMTPWSVPNIHGYVEYPHDVRLSDQDFVAIDNVRYHPARPGVMIFDYRADFRINTVVRTDSRMGPESSGVVLSGTAEITNGSRLETATDVYLAGSLTVRSESELHVAYESDFELEELHLESGASVTVSGNLSVRDLYGAREQILSTGGYVTISRLHPEPTGIEGAPPSDAPADIDLEELRSGDVQVYPNPFRTSLTVDVRSAGAAGVEIDVVDVLGRIVARLSGLGASHAVADRVVWRPTSTPRGTYFVRVRSGETVTVTPVTFSP